VDSVELIVLIVVVIVVLGAIFWWLVFTTEGVYLGPRVVIWLYDLYAGRYDTIKQYIPAMESLTLGLPILQILADIPSPLILDVATGTARLPLALHGQPAFSGHVIGLDYSRRMLAVAAEKIAQIGYPIDLIYQPAEQLPFDDNTFDMVTCLEALEFMSDADQALAEIVRVARPGATILLTNRKGLEARLMLGRTRPAESLAARLRDKFGLEQVTVEVWQVDYDQIWACKPGSAPPAPDYLLENILRCPGCGRHKLHRSVDSDLICSTCSTRIPTGEDGIIEYANARIHHKR
jgi:ubiquinone/menaquinone biosynthesis C-methylase UbiE